MNGSAVELGALRDGFCHRVHSTASGWQGGDSVNRIQKGGSCPVGISASLPQGRCTRRFFVMGRFATGSRRAAEIAETTATVMMMCHQARTKELWLWDL